MAAVVWADVEALQANLSSVSVAAQMIILAFVNEELNPRAFGGDNSARYHLARCYLAAHMGELERRNGGMKVTSETLGVSSITLAYAQAQVSEDALETTSWGSQYRKLVRMSPLRIGVRR